jgi:hypothetical protein
MTFTVISEGTAGPSATVVESVLDALNLARHQARGAEDQITIATDNGWILTLDELEEMVRQ